MHPHLHWNAVIASSCTGCCLKKSSSSTCQLIDGVEGASHGCNAPPCKRHFHFNVCLVNLPPFFFLWALIISCMCFRLLNDINDDALGATKIPGVWGWGLVFFIFKWMWEVFFGYRSATILGPPKESSSTSVNCATQHKRLPLQLSLLAHYVFNESLTVFKRNRQVLEWQITPVHRQALDDYHGKLTTGWGSYNLPVESNGKFFFSPNSKWLSISNRLSLV